MSSTSPSLLVNLRTLWGQLPRAIRPWLVFGVLLPVTATAIVCGVIVLNGLSIGSGRGCSPNLHVLERADPYTTEHLVYGMGPYTCLEGLPDLSLGLADMILLVQGGLMCLSMVLVASAVAWHVLTPLIPDRFVRTSTRVLGLWCAGALTIVMLHVGAYWFSGYMGFMGDSMCPGSFDGAPRLCTADLYVAQVTERALSPLGLAVDVALVMVWSVAYGVAATAFFGVRHIRRRAKRHTSTQKTP